MKRRNAAPALAAALILAATSFAYGQAGTPQRENKRLAQTGMKFLQVSVDPRSAAMGDAVTAQQGFASAMFYNPAGMAYLDGSLDVMLGQTQWIGEYKYNFAGIAFKPGRGNYGVVGLSLVAVDYGAFLETIRVDNEQGFEDLGTFSPTALSAGLGYARALTDRFSVGGNVKYVTQNLGSSVVGYETGGGLDRKEQSQSTVAFDFGVLYHTGFRSLSLAAGARNFSRELRYAVENFELPLTFRVGVAMDVMDLARVDRNTHSLKVAFDAERPRDFSEQIRAGAEYQFMNTVSLRAGYVYPSDEQGVNLGAGVQVGKGNLKLGVDYAYTDFGLLGSVNRIGLRVSL